MTSPWPYASVADADWMSPAGGSDAFLSAARDAVRDQLPHLSRPVSPEHLLTALGAAQQVRERMDWVLLSLVGEARAAGLSWAQVGEALGVRRQAAHQRFGPYVEAALEQARAQQGEGGSA